MNWLLRRLLALWVRYTVRPEDISERLQSRTNPVCYVLERRSATDSALLRNACVQLKLPRPGKRLPQSLRECRSSFYLGRTRGIWDERLDRRPPPMLVQMIEALRANPELDIDLVPVAVYWGRSPDRERSWFKQLLAEDWAITSRVRKVMQVLFNGLATRIEIDAPMSLRSLLGREASPALQARRVARALRALYRAQRAARIGPDLSHRRTLVSAVLRTRAVRAAVAQEAREKNLPRRQAMLNARRLTEEIAANYSPVFVRFMEHILKRLWNRLYDGVIFEHEATLEEVADGNEIIYVPCHRSHMDYLLLSYAIYRHGFAIPHIAAGINLNLPMVGRLLRKGGAFFIRRSFRGSSLYTVVFMRYLAAIMARGHSIEYFIEGGRSRTGRLLQPKTGMISMTVRSFIRDPRRPVVFLPVYFGYERIVEGETYINELAGKPKEKESVFGLLNTLPKLKERFGKVHVNLGEPIMLADVLARHDPDWRVHAADDDARLPWLGTAVDELASDIMRRINAAATVTPVNLLAITLLATAKHTLAESDLVRQLDLYRSLLLQCPYSDRVTVTKLSGADMLSYGFAMKIIARQEHTLGGLIEMSEQCATLATYYRNNVLHLFAMPSLIACAFVANASMRTSDIQRLVGRIYPYVAAELFLHWPESDVPEVVVRVLETLGTLGLIERGTHEEWRRPATATAEAVQLSLLAQATIQTVERYYLAIALLLKAGSGALTQSALELTCQQMAQRISMLYGFNSPEFFDRAMFENYIDLLRQRGVLRSGAEGRLEFDDVLLHAAQDAQLVLSEQIRHSILQVTHA